MRTRSSALSNNRETAKIAMAVSLGVLVTTGFLARSRGEWTSGARTLHFCAGAAMVGFSYWHWSLYQQPAASKGRLA